MGRRAYGAYVEPFAGGLSVLLNRPRRAREIVGDANPSLVGFWRELADPRSRLIAEARTLPYDEETFRRMKDGAPETPCGAALAFLVRNRFSRGGLGRDFAWSERLRGGIPGDANAWRTILDELPSIQARLQGVLIAHQDAESTIAASDGDDTLFYCDPPYVHASRTARAAYAFEMTDADHIRLLELLSACRGRVFLSGYRSALYDERLAGWRRFDFDMPNHSGQGKNKQRRTECVWINRDE